MRPRLPGVHGFLGLTPEAVARLSAWKLRERWRHTVDHLGGYTRLTARGVRWGEAWEADHGSGPGALQRWLGRPGGGVFWFGSDACADWARASCTPVDLDIAAGVSRGLFDILGSGSRDVGTTPNWRRDLYSGTEWPLRVAFRLPIARRDGSDIRTVWVMSRCCHFLPLARAYWHTGDARYRDAFVRHVCSWLVQNPLGYGPNWSCPMEVAMRAANWVVALLLFAPATGIPSRFWAELLGSLYATGLFLERYPEWHPVYRANHYLANGVGLLYLGTLFRDTPDGDRWLQAGARLMTAEIQRQVHPDGVSFEGALGYHRLAAELFTYAGELLRRNVAAGLPPDYEPRLRAMYRFIACYLPSTGEAPMMGDADDGRLHAVSAAGLTVPRCHRLGLRKDYWPRSVPTSTAFPHGGFYVIRCSDDHLIVRCGPVGLYGAGSHDHNDQLSFELTLSGRRVVTDSGTFTYTRDLAVRHAFRSTAAHSVVQLGAEEQNPIVPERPWRVLADRTQSQCVRWEVGPERQVFEGQHFGYAHRASHAVCWRRITAWGTDRRWEVVDRIDGVGVEPLISRFHLAPTEIIQLAASETTCELRLPGSPAIRLCLDFPAALRFSVGESAASDRYGVRYVRPVLLLAGDVALPAEVKITFTVEEA